MTRRLASRLGLVGTSPTIAVKMEADRLRREGKDIVDFGPGEPDLATPEPAKEAGIRAIREDFTHYTGAAGIAELRGALAEHYSAISGGTIEAEETVTGNGGKGILFATMMALVSGGDQVAIVKPYWVSFPEQVRLAGGSPVFAETSSEDGFTMRASQIESVLTPATTMIIVNSPSNPSGGVLPRDEAEALVELAIARDLWLVSDETYEAFVYDPADRVSLLEYKEKLGGRLIFVSAFSKTWAMTGWRIGYGIAEPDVVKAILKVQSHDTTHASSISQRAGVAALREAGDAPERMLDVYGSRRELIVRGLREIDGIECPTPRGAFYVFPDVRELCRRKGLESSVELSKALITEEGVATVPGEAFGMEGYLRLSYATSEARIEEGLARIARYAGA